MKKLLFLAVILCFMTMPVLADVNIVATDAQLSVNGVAVSDYQTGYASIESTFLNNGDSDITVTVVIAEYSDDGNIVKMNNVGIETKTIPAGKSAKIVPGLDISADTSLIKYFAYTSTGLQPIEVKSFKIENFRFMGMDDDGASVYEVNGFSDESDPAVDNTPSETLASPAVCTWEDNKTAAVSITIDDGDYNSALRYNELLKTYGIHSTQFMITNKLYSGNMPNTTVVANWQKIFDEGYMDLGNHSFSHAIKYNESSTYTQSELEEDISGSYSRLTALFPAETPATFATPWGQTPENVVTELKKHHYASRIAGGGVVKSKTPQDFYRIPTFAVQYGTGVSQLNGFVDTAVSSGGWYVELLHGIGAAGSGDTEYSSNYDTVADHFRYIKSKSDAGSVWAGSFNEVVKYIYERNSAKSEILWSTEQSVGIKVTDSLPDDEFFNYPLTFRVNVPSSWSGNVTVTQDGNSQTSEIFTENGRKYAFVKIVPDSGNAVLTDN